MPTRFEWAVTLAADAAMIGLFVYGLLTDTPEAFWAVLFLAAFVIGFGRAAKRSDDT